MLNRILKAGTIATLISPIAIYSPLHAKADENQTTDYYSVTAEKFNLKYSMPVRLSILPEINSRIIDISEIDQNWDGYGAQPPDAAAISNALRFLQILPENIIDKLKTENVEPTPYGTIVCDWEKGENLISIEIGNTKIGFFTDFKEIQNKKINGITFNENELPQEIIFAFNFLYKY